MSRAAVVTGGAHGIGRAVVDRLADGSRQVHVIDTDSPATPFPDQVTLHNLDVRDEDGMAAVLGSIVNAHDAIEALVVCAGVKIIRTVAETGTDDWDYIHDVNLKAMFVTIRQVLPEMLRVREGAIVTIGSPSGNGDPRSAVYASAKAAVVGFSKSVALEVAGSGVRINTVIPAFTRTRMTSSATPERITERGRLTASGSVNEPADIADAIAFLLSPEARNISGAVLEVGRTQGEPALTWTR